jgi:chromosome segregation ATPase
MSAASYEKPGSGGSIEILKVARQIQHLAHFLSLGPPCAGIVLTDADIRVAKELNPITRITSHRRLSELEFPREWVEDDGALAIALRDWRDHVKEMSQSNTHATQDKLEQTEDVLTKTDIEVDANVSVLSYPMKREAHWVEKTRALETKLRQSEQEKQSVMQHNLKLQLDVERLQRKVQALYQGLFDPDNRIHEANVMAKANLYSEIGQLKLSVDTANNKNDALIEKNKELESSNRDLVTQNESLVEKNKELESSNKDLVTENESLVEMNKELESSNADLFTTNQDLLEKIVHAMDAATSNEELLTAKNQALQSSNKVLVLESEALKTINDSVVAKYKDLEGRLEQSANATKSCNEVLDKIVAKIKELENSRNALAAQNKDLMSSNAVLGDENKQLEESNGEIVTSVTRSLRALTLECRAFVQSGSESRMSWF